MRLMDSRIEVIRADIGHSGIISAMFSQLHKMHVSMDSTLFKEISDIDLAEADIREKIEKKRRIFLLSYFDNTPCGYLEGSIRTIEEDMLFAPYTFARVENLYIYPSFRRKGCARALFDAFFEYASKKGIKRFELNAMNANKDAIAFYGSVGFSPQRTTFIKDVSE